MNILRNFAYYTLRRTHAAVAPHRSCPRSHANIMVSVKHGSILSTRKWFSINNHPRLHSEPPPKKPEEEHAKDKHVSLANQSSRKTTFSKWLRWTMGSMLCFFLPSWKAKWDALLTLEGKVEKAKEVAENVAEVVEQVASVAEQISEKVADKLPDDGTLKDTARLVNYVSKEAIKDAQLTKILIQKVDELKQEVVETVVDHPIVDSKKLLDKEDNEK